MNGSTAAPAAPARRRAGSTLLATFDDRVVRASVVLGVAWLAIFAALTAVVGGHPSGEVIVGDAVYLVPVALAAFLSLVVARRVPRPYRAFWFLLALSNVGWLAGEVTWSVTELGLDRQPPFPSLADAFYLSSYALMLPAVLCGFAPGLRARAARAALDASILVASLGYVGFVLLIEPQLGWGRSLATATGIAYPLLGVAIVMLLVSVAFAGRRGMPLSIGLVVTAFFLSALTDAAYTYLSVVNSYASGSWLNVGWQAEAVLLSIAAVVVIRRRDREPIARLADRDVGLPLVLAGTAAAVVLVGLDLMNGDLRPAGAILAGAALTAVVVRLASTASARERAVLRLELKTAELEERVRERDAARNELDHAVSLLQGTLDSTADGILVVGVDGRITGFNQRFLEMWSLPTDVEVGVDDDELLALAISQLADPDAFLERLRELYADPELTSFEEIHFADGRIYERYTQPQRVGGDIVGRVLSFRDVSERRRLEDGLRQSQKMEAVGRLAGGVAHDFNNLLTAILGHTERLEREIDDERARTATAEIRHSAQRAAQLTRQLLAVSRKQVLQLRTIDVNDVVRELRLLLRPLLGERIALTVAYADEPALVHVDPGQLEQVLLNLALNARDAVVDRGSLHVEIAHDPAADHVLVRVVDTGAGMDHATRERAFEPFFTTKVDGAGLGLPSVLGIIEQFGGDVELASAPGAGTAVTLRLPGAGEPAAVADGGLRTGSAGGGAQILLVEDNAVVRSLLAEELASDGYTVHVAESGDDALEIAGTKPVDLVVTDVMMPQMTGAELARRVAERWPHTRLLFISGHSEETLGREGVFDSGIRFLQKPFSLATLRTSVREALQQPV
jgi:two-component system cell cycle sensor histidine kinase/response regulator CckA